MNLKKVWWQIIGNLGRDSRLRRNPDLEGEEQDIRVRTSSWSYFCLLWRCQVQLWLLLLIVLQQSQGDKPGTDPFLLLTPVLNELSFSAPLQVPAELVWQCPRKLHLQYYIEVYIILTWGSRRGTSVGVGWVPVKHNSEIISHLRSACEFAFLLLFGLSSWLLFAEAMEDALKEEMCFVTDSGLLLCRKWIESWNTETYSGDEERISCQLS